ncbi:MAG TPA: PAS domain S-box protein [Acetobacteraceae bacterium]|nr:PAS domain S-box protein [Acetobacteraceae bacterium]
MEFDPESFAVTLVRAMADAVIYADSHGVVRFWNSGAERLFGFPEAEALGQTLDIIIPDRLRQRHWDGFNKTMGTGESRYDSGALLAVPAIRKDGRRISVEFTIVPFRDDAGRMQGIAAVLRDVTARYEEMQALRKKAANL